MKTPLRMLATALAALALAAPALAAKDVVFAVASTFTTTDPYDANDTLSQAVAKSFYEGLFGFDRNMKLIPVLAESYETSKDGLTYTVKLKHGIKFHDGTDFNADAVKANFDRVTNPDNKLKRYGLYSIIAKTEVVDPYTARITLNYFTTALVRDRAVLGIHQRPRASIGRDDQPGGAQAIRQQGHRISSGRHRPVQVRRVEVDGLSEGREERELLAQGLPEGRHDHVEAGRRQQLARRDHANRRGAASCWPWRVPARASACLR